MYKRHPGQVSMLDNPEFFGSLPLNPNNRQLNCQGWFPYLQFILQVSKPSIVYYCSDIIAFIDFLRAQKNDLFLLIHMFLYTENKSDRFESNQ